MTSSVIGAVAERAPLATISAAAIRHQIAEVRPDLSESTPTYRAAVLLLLGPQLRFNIDRLTARTRYPRAQVAACARRLFDHGVWRPEGPDYRWSSAEDEAFWLDVAVAEGQRIRRIDAMGELEWAEAGSWTKAYDFVTKDTSLTTAYVEAPPAPEIFVKEDVAPEPENGSDESPVMPEPARPAPAMAASFLGSAGVATASTDKIRVKWARPDGVKRSDLFPGAQWLS